MGGIYIRLITLEALLEYRKNTVNTMKTAIATVVIGVVSEQPHHRCVFLEGAGIQGLFLYGFLPLLHGGVNRCCEQTERFLESSSAKEQLSVGKRLPSSLEDKFHQPTSKRRLFLINHVYTIHDIQNPKPFLID